MTIKRHEWVIILAGFMMLVITLAAVVVTTKNRRSHVRQQPLTQVEKDLYTATTKDTTKAISDNLDSINVDDTSTTDLNGVDQELNKL
jgi:hypothetical protein